MATSKSRNDVLNQKNRYGDTAFRLQNQINFYLQILSFIYTSNEDKRTINSSDVYEYVIQEEIIKYSKDKMTNNRGSMILKQLIDFELVQKNGEKHIYCTKLGSDIVKIIEINSNPLANLGLNLSSIIFFYLMLTKGNLAKKFNMLVNFLFQENIKEITSDIKNSFIDNSFNFDENKFIKKNDINIPQITNEEIHQILEKENMQPVLKFRKPIIVNKSLPSLINNIDIANKILDSDNKLYDQIKKNYKWYSRIVLKKELEIKKKTQPNDLLIYINDRKEDLLQDTLSCIKYQTIEKDYSDINDRWFFQIKLFKKVNNQTFINDDLHIEIYKKILKNVNITIQQVIELCFNFNQTQELIFKPPFNMNEVIEILKKINDNKWLVLKEKFQLQNIANATLYEYFVNLSFYLTHNTDMKSFDKWCNTSYDANFKPIIHASGGKADGLVIETNNKSSLRAIIESTILERSEEIIKNEKISTQRHSYKYYLKEIKESIDNYSKQTPYTILVLNSRYNNEEIYSFSYHDQSLYFKDLDTTIKTLILNTNDLIDLLESNRLKNLLHFFYNKLPLSIDDRNKCLEVHNGFLHDLLNENIEKTTF